MQQANFLPIFCNLSLPASGVESLKPYCSCSMKSFRLSTPIMYQVLFIIILLYLVDEYPGGPVDPSHLVGRVDKDVVAVDRLLHHNSLEIRCCGSRSFGSESGLDISGFGSRKPYRTESTAMCQCKIQGWGAGKFFSGSGS